MLCIFSLMQNAKKIIHLHNFLKCRKHHILTNSVMSTDIFIYANRNKAEPREVTKQVVWIILRNGIFHGTFQHNRSGFPSYARKLCALTLPAYALKHYFSTIHIVNGIIQYLCIIPFTICIVDTLDTAGYVSLTTKLVSSV